ncbi:sporulation protein [Actinomadura rugatobispora]|uniref:Sporulation protein n=1 Tax=Actinomadura rugatobispora TaxID=1994 RepID=A0ABW1AIQ0_9ACTN|nr:hypothetical protein GCM10010200_082170 [Actinomadura rugatobispora]
MVFKQLLGAFGVGGPSIETVPAVSMCRPGEYLSGEVRLQGGEHDVHVHGLDLSLATVVEYEHEDHEGEGVREFHRGAITDAFLLGAGQYQAIPFQMPLPWELPLTDLYGQHLHGCGVGVRTELRVAGAADTGDLDSLSVYPLPSQQRVLDAFGALGFAFKSADVEQGHIAGVHQQLPFYQEIEFLAPPHYAGRIEEVELTFVASPHELAVILEADRSETVFSEGDDVFGRFHVAHGEALHLAWEHELERWLQAVTSRHHGGHDVHHHDQHGHGDHGHGPGWGGVAAGAVGGVAAGFVAGAVVNELVDDDDDEDGDEDAAAEADAAAANAYQAAVYEQAVEEAVEDAYEDAYEQAYEEATESFEEE